MQIGVATRPIRIQIPPFQFLLFSTAKVDFVVDLEDAQ